MKKLFDDISIRCSKNITESYSTSFSFGIKFLGEELRKPIYSIYGYVRLADEIVDSFHGYDQSALLSQLREETIQALKNKISLNPVINSFQLVVHEYGIEEELIFTFLDSMEMDLSQHFYTRKLYEKYIYGSAEVVGLMCLKVFCREEEDLYEKLKIPAMKLGSAFQKVNFLRDIKADTEELGRLYFPNVDLKRFTEKEKIKIEQEIAREFEEALEGILKLPNSSCKGVLLAYKYYIALFKRIKLTSADKIMMQRIRVPNTQKFAMMLQLYVY